MYKQTLTVLLLFGLLLSGCDSDFQLSESPHSIADKDVYLETIGQELSKQWPDNRTVTIVCHGHSVPAGYFNTPVVRPFESYPHLLHKALKERYPDAVINVTVTAIGGEHSVDGAKRFRRDVLGCQPDVILIDYALNDRSVGLDVADKAWSRMIEQAMDEDIKVLLLTPTPDIHHVPDDTTEELNHHADQIRSLAKQYHVGLVDSLAAFDTELKKGTSLSELLSNGYNHPNKEGHEIVVQQILEWF
ncbi:MAG: SGNH/GDSL hydrolase family protein [Planctomycetota bacterium]|jgi:lysophospholipase L1-like esterase